MNARMSSRESGNDEEFFHYPPGCHDGDRSLSSLWHLLNTDSLP